MTINVPNPEALRAGIRHAEDDLKHWDQEEFLRHWDQEGEDFDLPETGEPPCGTASCLAGHILLAQGMSWKRIQRVDISGTALQALGFETELAGEDFFDRVFCHTEDAAGVLGGTSESFERFKAHVTRVTGVEL